MRSFRCTIARTIREITDAQRLRWTVYGEEERLLPAGACTAGREIDALDYADTTVHFLVYAGSDLVGTVRLLQPRAGEDGIEPGRIGLDLESKVDLGALAAPGIAPAEVTRYVVARDFRRTGVTSALFQGLFVESVRRGVTHWVAGANMETDCPEDAAIAYRIAHENRLVSDRFRAEPREHEPPRTRRLRPGYTALQRQLARDGDLAALELPRTLSLFARRMSARFIGPPVYDEYFNVFALPLVASLADVVARRPSAEAMETQAPSREEEPV